jgi:predicted  nucleic acid-binding Zn-ribbon protein
MGVDLATQAATAAGNAAAQAIAGGLAEAASMAGQQAAAQLLETMAREKHEKKENEWQEQKNANMKTAIAEYKRQVASLSEALRNQAEDAKETLGFAASTAERVEELQAEAQVREAAFEEELHAVQTQVADARKEVAHGREEIRRLEQELKNAKSAAEFFVGQAKGADEDADGSEGSLAHELQVKAANDARKKLEALKVVALHKKAVSSGLELDSIDAAMESEDPKPLLVDMLLAAQRQKAEAAFMKVLFA